MSSFKPIDPKGLSDRDLMLASLRQGDTLHECFEAMNQRLVKHIDETERVHGAAAKLRLAMDKKIDDLAATVGGIQTNQEYDSGRITKLAKMFGAESVRKGEKRPQGRGLATWAGWKLFTAISGGFTLLVVCFQLAAKIAPVVYDYLMGLSP